jgi:ubiquinol-cytochrome c reductase cytochrome b subunit
VLASIGALTLEGMQEPWKPDFSAAALTTDIIGSSTGPIFEGGQVFNDKGCIYCHSISGHGGQRGPELTDVGSRLTHDQIVIRIMNGGYNMPSFAHNLSPDELAKLTQFLESRKVK